MANAGEEKAGVVKRGVKYRSKPYGTSTREILRKPKATFLHSVLDC